MRKHERECIRLCRAAGLSVLRITYGKHLKIICQQGTIVCASTPSDVRWARNMQALARRVANDAVLS